MAGPPPHPATSRHMDSRRARILDADRLAHEQPEATQGRMTWIWSRTSAWPHRNNGK